jgi:hypothetical protein
VTTMAMIAMATMTSTNVKPRGRGNRDITTFDYIGGAVSNISRT